MKKSRKFIKQIQKNNKKYMINKQTFKVIIKKNIKHQSIYLTKIKKKINEIKQNIIQ